LGIPTGSSGAVGAGGDGQGIPVDPKCASVKPVDGTPCDPQGPELCSVGANACFCAASDDWAYNWTCVDVGSGGIDLGSAQGGSAGGAGRDNGSGNFNLGGGSWGGFTFN
jgi:hypothetical protein